MLRHLHIRNFAIVDELELAFERGMTVLTGETGAGKSILLDALGLTLGERSDSGIVRSGASRAEVSAEFDLTGQPAVTEWLAAQELDAEGECIVRRTVNADGRSRGYINGHTVPIQQLKRLGDFLVDIHGQHAHQSLLRRDEQRRLLDAYAGHEALVTGVAEAYKTWRGLSDELHALTGSVEERDARLELLRYQVDELDALELRADELQGLEEEHQRLANASRLIEGSQQAVNTLYESDEGALLTQLNRVISELRELTRFDEALLPSLEILESAAIQVQEGATELRHYVGALELDPERLAIVEERLAAIHDLARKHRVEPEGLPAHLEQLRQELENLEQAGSRLAALESAIARARSSYLEAAARLSASRQRTAGELGERVSDGIHQLGMGQGRFEVNLAPLDESDAAAHGLDRVEFLVSANPGQPLQPLAKVASGGELSRISLSIQVIAAGRGGVSTLVFDEVDVGVGGGVAEMVGRQLRLLGSERQVLCVTHQPQVAALGHHHLQVRKESDGDVTTTRIQPLDHEARVAEVARMLGGLEITERTQSHASEMLAMAREGEPKRKRRKAG